MQALDTVDFPFRIAEETEKKRVHEDSFALEDTMQEPAVQERAAEASSNNLGDAFHDAEQLNVYHLDPIEYFQTEYDVEEQYRASMAEF